MSSLIPHLLGEILYYSYDRYIRGKSPSSFKMVLHEECWMKWYRMLDEKALSQETKKAFVACCSPITGYLCPMFM